jgi:putative alpha-1,2-mannosidase
VRCRHLTLLAALLFVPAQAHAADLAQYVDPLIGTAAPGFVFPGADAPFGMVQNSPDTLGPLVYSGYMHHDAAIRGFSLVHLSGPGVDKAGELPFMPWTGVGGTASPPSDPTQYASPYNHATEQAKAGYYEVRLANGVDVELTASEHAAMQRYAFPPATDAYLIVNPKQKNSGPTDGAFTKTGPAEISGWTKSRYPVFFVARFSEPIEDVGAHWVKFAPGKAVTMRVGISFVDHDGARRNLAAEAPDTLSFDAMRQSTYSAWNTELNKVQVTGLPTDLKTFYTALYHALLHPNTFTDVDGRYRGFDDQIHHAGRRTQYANFSSWDTYKAQNQLLALLYPERYEDMLRSLLRDAQQGGRLPRWGEQSYDASHMSGDPAIPMIADGYCRGIIGDDVAEDLYAEAVELRGYRDEALDRLGYLPMRPGTTLEYGIADFSLALLAQGLGHRGAAQEWLARSLSYRKMLDPETKWIRPREADGTYYAGFHPFLDETGFQEGNSWQYSWLVPHDPRGLFDRMGGDAAVIERLDEFFTLPAEAQTRATFFGVVYRLPQWAPGNEHDLGAPFLYGFAGQPWKLQAEMREAQQLYRPTVDGLPGNDDLGSLSAWYVFSALGFSPFTPGAPLHMVGSPLFERAKIALPGGGTFTVEAPGTSLLNRYVQDAALDGAPLTTSWFAESAVKAGGTLRLTMGPRANTAWGSAKAPPSATGSPLEAFGC